MNLDRLRKDLEKKLGQRIEGKKDAIALEAAIYEDTGLMVSYNTIRRFFGLAKGGQPSKNILDIYAHYLGFKDIDTYESDKNRFLFYNDWSIIMHRDSWSNEQISLLVESAMQENVVAQSQLIWSLNKLFTHSSLSEWARWFSLPQWKMSKHSLSLIMFYVDGLGEIIRSKISTKQSASKLISYPSLKSNIVYLFVDYSTLIDGYYGRVAEALYKESPDDLFANSLLGLRNFWEGNYSSAEDYFEVVVENPIDHHAYPILNSRILAAQVFLDWRYLGLLSPETYQKIINYLDKLPSEQYYLALMELLPFAAVLGFSNEVISIYLLFGTRANQNTYWSAPVNLDIARLSYMIALANGDRKAEFCEIESQLKYTKWYLSYKSYFRALYSFGERRLGRVKLTFEEELKHFHGLNSLN